MYKLINGWTKESVMAQVKKYNNGTRATNEVNGCAYKLENGNRCAVGCFIPDGHMALWSGRFILDLLGQYPELKELMPFEGSALASFQKVHDETRAVDDVRDKIAEFLASAVE